MRHPRHDIACCFLLLLRLLTSVTADLQDLLRLQHRGLQLPQDQISFNDYPEYNDNKEISEGSEFPDWNQVPTLEYREYLPKLTNDRSPRVPDVLNKNIMWDSTWKPNVELGQISAVSIDPYGRIAIFHRGSRIWGTDTFDNENRFDPKEGPVIEDTVALIDKTGRKIVEWGRTMFYLPHGLTVDSLGNYWMTDVAMHQVFKFDAKDIENHVETLRRDQLYPRRNLIRRQSGDPFPSPKPSLILGEAFQPGNDDKRFCKPTAVAVHSNGDFFVSDGYCNSRIVKYNAKGEKILQWGRHWGLESMFSKPPPNAFFIPHALALAEELDCLFVADREDGRVVAFFASNGTFHKEYKHPSIGTKIYSVAYAQKKIYLINGPDLYPNNFVHVRGFVLDVFSGDIVSQFGPWQDMDRPHDLAVTQTGSEIYVVELNIHLVYRFLQDANASTEAGSSKTQSFQQHDSILPVDRITNSPTTGGTATATLVLSLVTAAVIFIALCVLIAALVARSQKRGCLLGARNRMRWDGDKRENFKLSSLLEAKRCKRFKLLERRPNTRDFSKLNTEPETSDDENPENSLTRII